MPSIRQRLFPSVVLPLVLLAQVPAGESSSDTDELWLKITQSSGLRRLSLVIAPFLAGEPPDEPTRARLNSIQQVFEADLRFSLYFTFQVPDSGLAFDFETDSRRIDIEGWASTGAEVLICGDMVPKRSGPSLELRLYDLSTGRRIASKPYPLRDEWRWLAHEMADDVIKLLTGEDGVSRTRICFTQSLGRERKELSGIDYDGAGLVQLTTGGGVRLFPDWAPDGHQIAYCTYGDRSLNIYRLDVSSRNRTAVSERPGLNTTPSWSPDGRTIAASLSFAGQSDLYLLNPDGTNPRRLTTSPAIDVSPSWSPSGRQLAFVSDRTGSPQVYIVNVDGTDLRRLTFEGSYNTAPAWSPRGDLVAFVQRQPNGSNQVCVTNISGDTYLRLTTRGNNEDPCWSPDGLHLAFSSSRTGCFELFVMDWTGANQTQLTRTGGATSPAWSPRIR